MLAQRAAALMPQRTCSPQFLVWVQCAPAHQRQVLPHAEYLMSGLSLNHKGCVPLWNIIRPVVAQQPLESWDCETLAA